VNRLIVATTNSGKVIEIESALGQLPGWSLEPLPGNIPSIEESGATFAENAIQKAKHYSRYVDSLTLADDSGLCVPVLDGRPGVHSARYAENPPARIRRLLREMENVTEDRRHAVFYCALAVAQGGKVIWTVQSDVAGIIAHAPSGTEGFGYDPIFILPKLNRTMAELSTEQKNRFSARGQAVAELRKWCLNCSGGL
jgi:XTP/dITP diphosphohydrolase